MCLFSATKKLVFAFLWQERTFNVEKLQTPTGIMVRKNVVLHL